MKQLLLFGFAVCAAVALSSCMGKKSSAEDYVGIDGDYVTGMPLPDRVDGANFFGSTVNRSQFEPVYFTYDGFTVSDGELMKLETVVASLNNMRNDIIIAGFTDERGTEEYNRGLGERRAQAVREQLIAMGIPGNRIQTVSFGEEMPADPGSGEAAWAKNRRAEFGVIK